MQVKKNQTTSYTLNTFIEDIKKGLFEKIIIFAVGSIVSLIVATFTVFSSYSGVVARTDESAEAIARVEAELAEKNTRDQIILQKLNQLEKDGAEARADIKELLLLGYKNR